MEECEGYSVLEAFGELSKKYITEYGNDEYNGTISTCSFRSLYKIASKCGKTTAQQAYQYIEKNGRKMTKRVADAVDCGITGYDMFTIKKTAAANKKSPKYELRYAVYEYAEEREPCIVVHCKTKTEADQQMLKFAAGNISKNIITSHYEVRKCYVDVANGDPVVTGLSVIKKRYKTKPKMPKDTASCVHVLKECHLYIFYGLAAE